MSENTDCTESKKKKKRRKRHTVPAKTNASFILANVVGSNENLNTSMESMKLLSPTSGALHTAVNRKNAGQNWETQLQKNLNPDTINEDTNGDDAVNEEKQQVSTSAPTLSKAARLRQKRKANQLNKYVAMDCEMVGIGLNGQEDMLARVSIVNKRGEVLIDKFVKPRESVTDYRTSVSGIRSHDIENGEDFRQVQEEVIQLLQGKILVGHAIRNDLAVLHIKHPYSNIRDTARYKPLCRLVANGRTPSLKRLTLVILGQEIQTGEHNSVEDARAAMNIYNRLSSEWEKYLKKHQHRKL
ncbi:uncharacterized protein LOC106096207 [Stomoxys calcitrans]|uniref:RNA exonuclease 4 n=1 Tax=Stomoxys calcitrans TaxID=35570 RepID=A0A1I8QFB6_STOCA|nr:uncharacterized protein LOC106096207 [Stomoxys calcitrans]